MPSVAREILKKKDLNFEKKNRILNTFIKGCLPYDTPKLPIGSLKKKSPNLVHPFGQL